MEHQDRFSLFSLYVLFSAALGGCLFGYHIAVISGVLEPIEKMFQLTAWESGFLVSSLLLGGLVGSLSAGALADLWGRKKTLLLTASIYGIGAFVLGFAQSYQILLFGRMICGFAVGLSSVISPLYLAEIAAPHYRGRFVCTFQFMITLGILLAYGANLMLDVKTGWHLVFFISFIPAAIQVFCLLFVPETPGWLLRHHEKRAAKKTLKHLRDDKEWQAHLPEMEKTAAPEKKGRLALLWQPHLRKIVFIGLILSIFQQITGINAVIFYTPKIFTLGGAIASENALLATFAVGIINSIATFVTLWFLDKAGRRRLLLIGSLAMMLNLLLLSWGLFFKDGLWNRASLFGVLGYVAGFAIGFGPILWVILSEIYPLKIRGKAMGLALFVNWVASYFVSLTFLTFIERIGISGTFLIYALISALAFLFILLYIPETKGKSLEEIEAMVTKGKL